MPSTAAVRVADQAAAELVELRRQHHQRAAFLERHQPAAARYRAVVGELSWRTRATSRALESDPPPWLTGLLGDISESGRGRRAWRQTAARLQTYRDSYQLTDPERPLGGEPTGDLTQRRAWRAAQQAIDRYQRHHRVHEQHLQRVRLRWRTVVAALLIMVACVLAPLSVVAVWARNQVTDTDRCVRTVEPLARDPAIQQAVADRITTQVFTYLDIQG